ncbi:arylsulfatase [Echinicola strongylocentroti]|uniref:Arylsulfatase n=1 Tax=Echinicola strongylocentroti TaxID=1795355 RepID=A0A2Z4INQ5_9BACT|nr:sulfatase [Echinicola strongylocentroti]AWW32732.1 arylsulfatase [Echinicola strongylocentroti]
MKLNHKSLRNMKLSVFILLVCFSSSLRSQAQDKPNIILIFVDDLGYGDLGCYGSPTIETPHIDRMASEGIRFTSFYAAAVCGPSRAQLMTGSYHSRVSHSFNELPESQYGLHSNETTIPELLKTAGYKTMHIGKWHLGDAPEFLPTRQGFDKFFGFPYSHDMWPYHCNTTVKDLKDTALMQQILERADEVGYTVGGEWSFPPLPLMEDEEVIELNPDQVQMTTRFTEKAIEFIENNSRQPFFLYLAHTMPHTPLFASDKFKGKSDRGLYGDAIMEVDWSCGQIIEKLKELGIDNNTLVVFSSDNGPTPKYGTDGGSAGPLRGAKGSLYEGGIRVPAIFRWTGNILGGRRTNAMASTIDLLPTFAHLAGAEIPGDRIIDGTNLSSLLMGKKETSPHRFLHYFGGSQAKAPANYRAIRDDKWKMFLKNNSSGELAPLELYNLEKDPSEKYDKLKQHPEISNRLLKEAEIFYAELEKNKRPVGELNSNTK